MAGGSRAPRPVFAALQAGLQAAVSAA